MNYVRPWEHEVFVLGRWGGWVPGVALGCVSAVQLFT